MPSLDFVEVYGQQDDVGGMPSSDEVRLPDSLAAAEEELKAQLERALRMEDYKEASAIKLKLDRLRDGMR